MSKYTDHHWVHQNCEEAASLIEQQQVRIMELEATVERLRGAVVNYHDENIAAEEAMNELWDIHNATPHQTLNAVKRDAYRDGFMSSAEGFNGELYNGGWRKVVASFDEELNQRYPD